MNLWRKICSFFAGAFVSTQGYDYSPHLYPRYVTHSLVRNAESGLHPQETQYQLKRAPETSRELHKFLVATDVDFDPTAYNSTIGLAFSGGGYRAMLIGAGEVAAMDSRTSPGPLSGLLQASSYMVGLSGGSWLIGSMYFNGFPTIEQILDNPNIWNLRTPMFLPPNDEETIKYYTRIMREVLQKKKTGHPVTVTDIWGRMLHRQLIDRMRPQLWSQLRREKWFKKASAPYPLVVMNSRMPVYKRADLTTPIFEISPYEIGTFDPDPNAFAEIEFIGTPIYRDMPVSSSYVVTGVDNAGFILGVASSLFDQIIVGVVERMLNSPYLADFTRTVLHSVGVGELRDVGVVAPNPFFGHITPERSQHNSSSMLYLSDGGANKQNIPIQPLLVPHRKVDAIFAFDNGGADLDNAWPDGYSLSQSYSRSLALDSGACPPIPDQHTMVNLGLAEHATFFGCDGSNMTDTAPVIIYVPNDAYSGYSNTSTFKLSYTDREVREMVENGYHVGSQSLDSDWATCIGCAVTQRSRERQGHSLSPKCQACFAKYCWKGNLDPNQQRALRRLAAPRRLKMRK